MKRSGDDALSDIDGKLGMRMTVDATGDNLISLQGLGFITFTDEDGGPIGDADEDDRDSDPDDFNEDVASSDQQLKVGLGSRYHPSTGGDAKKWVLLAQ